MTKDDVMSKELKPCPFCGGEAEMIYTNDNKRRPYIRCRFGVMENPKCQATQFPWSYKTEAEAIKAWNRRVQ